MFIDEIVKDKNEVDYEPIKSGQHEVFRSQSMEQLQLNE